MFNENNLLSALTDARESEDSITRSSFSGCEVHNFDAFGIEFENVNFSSCRFFGCDFTKCSFYNCNIENCLFSSCTFSDSYWQKTQTTGCKCDGGDWRGAVMKESGFFTSSLRYTNFARASLSKCELRDCCLAESAMSEMRLNSCVLDKLDFTGAVLFKTALSPYNLSDCVLDGITISENCTELRGCTINLDQAAQIAQILGITVV